MDGYLGLFSLFIDHKGIMRKVSALLLATERRAISGLAGLYASRMLGLFMVLPVLALYADTLSGATPC